MVFNKTMKQVIIRITDDKLKEHFEKYAQIERRSLNQFIINATVNYIKERYQDDYDKRKSN
jgi:hypothetical protein